MMADQDQAVGGICTICKSPLDDHTWRAWDPNHQPFYLEVPRCPEKK